VSIISKLVPTFVRRPIGGAVLLSRYPDQLKSGGDLYVGEFLKDSTGTMALYLRKDGNLVLNRSGINRVWATNTPGGASEALEMQTDGNLVLRGKSNQVLWSSGTAGFPGAELILQSDGNLVIYDKNQIARWATGTDLRLTLLDTGNDLHMLGERFTPNSTATILYLASFYSEFPNPRPFPDPIYLPINSDGQISTTLVFDRRDTNIRVVASDSTGLTVSRTSR
jgi:hypothetical protein